MPNEEVELKPIKHITIYTSSCCPMVNADTYKTNPVSGTTEFFKDGQLVAMFETKQIVGLEFQR